MKTKQSTSSIKAFLCRKILREFKWAYIPSMVNYGLFKILNALEAITLYKAKKHLFLKPAALLVQINKICNFNCEFCFVNDLNEKVAKEFTVTGDIFERMLSHPLLSSLVRIGFTGGEPLIHPQLFEYIEKAKRQIPVVTFNTNFALAGKISNGVRYIDLINRSSLDLLTISLYARNVKEIEEFAPELNNKFFKRLSFIVSSGANSFHSFERMYDVAEMAKRLGFNGVYYQNFDAMEGVPEQKANLNKNDISSYAPIFQNEDDTYKQYLAITKRIDEEFGDSLSITFPVLKQKLSKVMHVKSYSCYQPDFQIGVDAKGNLAPCCNLDRLPDYGNLFTPENWNNETFQKIRAGIKKISNKMPTPYCANCTYLNVNLHDA